MATNGEWQSPKGQIISRTKLLHRVSPKFYPS